MKSMKNILMFLGVAFLFQSCQTGEPSEEVLKLRNEKEQLKNASAKKDSAFVALVRSFNEIEENLSMVKEKQGIITMDRKGMQENGENRREKILENIQMINDLMDENRKKIKGLEKKLGFLSEKLETAGLKINELEKMVDRLMQTVEQKDFEINGLKSELVELNFSLDSMTMAFGEQSEIVENQEMALNTAHFCFGTFKELKEKGVITKEGGFIGIGRTEKLLKDFNTNYFTTIDITKTIKIDLFVKEVKLVTTHSEESFEFIENAEGMIESLLIKQPEKFWSVSKYLVMVVE
jgi:archaellum component FlaC